MNHSSANNISVKPATCSALTIDVEDGINILMQDIFSTAMDPTTRVIDNVQALLDLFQENNTKATFFILGEIALSYPNLVKKIASQGHEIGVHGYHHDQIFRLKPQKAREDLYKAKCLIEDVSGCAVHGFRAPAFSIDEKTSWCLEVLSELGFKYDSSIMPVKANRYGWPGFPREIQQLNLTNGSTIIEVPLSVIDFMGKTIPACGGGYLRYFPYLFTHKAFTTIRQSRPVIVYLHPYEIDTIRYPDFFYKAKAALPLKKKLPLSFYRLNKGTVKRKLGLLVKEFPFKPVIEIINDLNKLNIIPARNL
jgi:polysaccharide deacetylase family protein (PEP-CTERM system associated)